jgi:hypothetical protein
MTTDNFCFYLQNRLIQISQTGGQWYNDTSPFSFPWYKPQGWQGLRRPLQAAGNDDGVGFIETDGAGQEVVEQAAML